MSSEDQVEENQPQLDSDKYLINQLGNMIDAYFEEEYTAIVTFTGHKLNRGFRIKSLSIIKKPKTQGG